MKHNYQERKENRIEYARLQAAKQEKLSNDFYVRSSDMAKAIPFGQPILVGHHSEKGDRRYRATIHNLMDKSVKAGQASRYYEDKAEAIENNTAISSDNPEALDLLRKKLAALLARQEFMKNANRCVKKNDKTAFMKLDGATEEQWGKLNIPDGFHGKGYPKYRLTNNNGVIRNTRQRIEYLEQLEKRTAVDIVINGIRIYENKEANRLQIYFGSKPPEAIRKRLSKCGFRWCRTEVAWQRNISNHALYDAKDIITGIPDDVVEGLRTPDNRLS